MIVLILMPSWLMSKRITVPGSRSGFSGLGWVLTAAWLPSTELAGGNCDFAAPACSHWAAQQAIRWL